MADRCQPPHCQDVTMCRVCLCHWSGGGDTGSWLAGPRHPVNRWRMERNARLILVLSHLPTTCPRAILLTNDSQSVTKNNFIFFFFLWPAMNELRLSPYGAQKASSSPHHIFFSLGNTEWTFGPHQRLCTLSNVMKWIEVF